MLVTELETPAITIDLDVMEQFGDTRLTRNCNSLSRFHGGGTFNFGRCVCSKSYSGYTDGAGRWFRALWSSDRNVIGVGAAALENCALSVVVMVVSNSVVGQAIIDGGSKTFSFAP